MRAEEKLKNQQNHSESQSTWEREKRTLTAREMGRVVEQAVVE